MAIILGEALHYRGNDKGVALEALTLPALVEAAIEHRKRRRRQAEMDGHLPEILSDRIEAQQVVRATDFTADANIVDHRRHAPEQCLEARRLEPWHEAGRLAEGAMRREIQRQRAIERIANRQDHFVLCKPWPEQLRVGI